jgi:hypothetical protein
MIDLPHRGNMLVARCRGCGHEVRFNGREIVTRFTKWLPAPISDWASTLRCGECQSRWIMVFAVADGAAQGFFQDTTETGQVVWCRRLNTYLAEAGTDLWAYLDVLSDIPILEELERARIGRLGAKKPPSPSEGARRRVSYEVSHGAALLPGHRSLRLAPTPQSSFSVKGS